MGISTKKATDEGHIMNDLKLLLQNPDSNCVAKMYGTRFYFRSISADTITIWSLEQGYVKDIPAKVWHQFLEAFRIANPAAVITEVLTKVAA